MIDNEPLLAMRSIEDEPAERRYADRGVGSLRSSSLNEEQMGERATEERRKNEIIFCLLFEAIVMREISSPTISFNDFVLCVFNLAPEKPCARQTH